MLSKLYFIGSIRWDFILFAQQYTNSFIYFVYMCLHFYFAGIHSDSTLMCFFRRLSVGSLSLYLSLWYVICVNALRCICVIHIASHHFFQFCVLQFLFFVSAWTNRFYFHFGASINNSLRPGKFQFYYTICRLILLVYINR